VAFLVEYPVVLRGSFDREFLKLPRQVIINAMREHQRYFSVVDENGDLLPCFLTVSNTKATDMEVVRRGNERVLRARLSDAIFYYEKDIAVPLTRRAEELKGVVFQAKLGTSYEKVERFTALALFIGERVGFSGPASGEETAADYLTESFNPSQYDASSIDPGLYSRYVLGRSAVLAKADLVTGIVGEFPKLQGVMGSVYAERAGEVPEVATAIYEHYLPSSAGGALPASVAGAIVSIADKCDTICGCFGIGQRPTGAADPYALRRSALGIISIVLEKSFDLPLDLLVERSLDLLGKKLTEDRVETKAAVIEFFKERLRNMLLSEDFSFDSIDAVLSAPWFDLADAASRVRALETFKTHPACTSLVTSFKRVSNILKGTETGGTPDPALFEDDIEKALFDTSERIAPVIEEAAAKGDYGRLFETLASIKDDIDAFFDHVMVMVDDTRVRDNRLSLLTRVRSLYFRTADLSRLAI
jgi:glycyl-tRNA synthetase beta chain